MALSVWPTTLPRYFERESLNVVPKANKIVSQPEVGPTRSRLRSTVRLYTVNGDLILTATQRDSLLTFYHTTLKAGTQRFTWHHPWNENTAVTMKFLGDTEPRITALGSLVFVAACSLEMQL